MRKATKFLERMDRNDLSRSDAWRTVSRTHARIAFYGADHVVIDKGSITDQVRQLVPDGVDAVVELVGKSETVEDSLLTIRPRGVLSLVGILGDQWDYPLPRPPSTIRISSYSSETLTTATATPVLQTIVDRVAVGSYQANIHQILDFTDLPQGHTHMEANLATGKLVVQTR